MNKKIEPYRRQRINRNQAKYLTERENLCKTEPAIYKALYPLLAPRYVIKHGQTPKALDK